MEECWSLVQPQRCPGWPWNPLMQTSTCGLASWLDLGPVLPPWYCLITWTLGWTWPPAQVLPCSPTQGGGQALAGDTLPCLSPWGPPAAPGLTPLREQTCSFCSLTAPCGFGFLGLGFFGYFSRNKMNHILQTSLLVHWLHRDV